MQLQSRICSNCSSVRSQKRMRAGLALDGSKEQLTGIVCFMVLLPLQMIQQEYRVVLHWQTSHLHFHTT